MFCALSAQDFTLSQCSKFLESNGSPPCCSPTLYKIYKYLDENEYLKYFECSVDDAYELINLGYINDVQSKYVMSCAKEYIKK